MARCVNTLLSDTSDFFDILTQFVLYRLYSFLILILEYPFRSFKFDYYFVL